MAARFLRLVYPLRLRQSLAARVFEPHLTTDPAAFRHVPLACAPGCRVQLCPTDSAHRILTLTGLYELPLSRRMVRWARRPGGLLVDVGANYGYYGLLWAAARPSNRVLALEAAPANVAALKANIAANALDDQWDVRELAAGKVDGRARLALGPATQTGWAGLVADTAEAGDRLIDVPCARLDTLLGAACDPRICVLKIDAEGADTWVLEGAEALLAAGRIEHIVFEDNPARREALGIAAGAAQALLERHGYRVERLTANDLYATRAGTARARITGGCR